MQELKVIGVEEGALIAVSDEGDRFLVAIDAVMQTKLRQLQSQRPGPARVSPREIQAHIRSGMTREQAAAAAGASVEDVERYEGPVLAERDHMLAQALSTAVNVAGDDALTHTFGTVLRGRLHGLNATADRWACWKDDLQGWVIKVEFTADSRDHDARWAFDVRRHALLPLNSDAITLSQHDEIRGGLIPKLRAVRAETGEQDRSRFDSGAFVLDHSGSDSPFDSIVPQPEHSLPTATAAAMNREDEPARSQNDTADLLESLRKRRGEREAMQSFDMFADGDTEAGIDESANETVTFERETIFIERERHEPAVNPLRRQTWGAPAESETAELTAESAPRPGAEQHGPAKRRSGRTSLPSWDEIVFGARSEDDPA